MTTIAIVISTENGGIGMNDSMPWKLHNIKDAYDELAASNVVLVGRKSYHGQEHVRGGITYVYSRDESFVETDTVKHISGTPEEVINQIKEAHPDKDIIIGGGKEVFLQFWDLIDEWRVTMIEEFTIFNKLIDMTEIQYKWKTRRKVSSGTDSNQNFTVYHFTK